MSKNTEEKGIISVKARAYPIAAPKGKTLAYASVNIGDIFAVNGIRVMDGEKGIFVAMPSAKDRNGEYRDVCFPVIKELRQEINRVVLEAYEQAVEKPSVREQLSEGSKNKEAPGKEAKEKPQISLSRSGDRRRKKLNRITV